MSRITEAILACLVFLASISILLLTPNLVMKYQMGGRVLPFSSRTFPSICLIAIILLTMVWIVLLVRKGIWEIDSSIARFDKTQIRVLITLGILIAGKYAVDLIGFVATNALLTGSLLFFFGIRRIKVLLFLSLTTSLFIYLFFEVLMKIPLPKGLIFE